MVQATSDTTTGEKKIVRKTVMPLSLWLTSTASSNASVRLNTTSPAEKMPVAVRTSPSAGSAASF